MVAEMAATSRRPLALISNLIRHRLNVIECPRALVQFDLLFNGNFIKSASTSNFLAHANTTTNRQQEEDVESSNDGTSSRN